MKHKFLIPTLVSLMMLSENALAAVSGNCGARSGSGTTQDPYVYADTCQWTLDTETGEMTISGTGNMYYAEYDYNQNKWPRPWASYISSIKTVTVEDGITSVANGAFSGATHLESVDMSNSLTRIGNSAFWSTALTSVSIPSSVTSVEANAFRNATGLKDITFEGNMPNCGIGWIQDDPSDLIISFSGGEADKNKLLHAIQIGGAYQEVCQNGHSNCTYTPSAQENVTLRLMEPDGTMIYFNDQGNIIKMGGKRIYTVEEATKATGKVNKISIRYR